MGPCFRRDDASTSFRQFVGSGTWSSISALSVALTSTLASTTPACCSARPAARMESRCGAPMRLWVSSVRSLSCLSTTASGSLVTPMKVVFIGQRIFARFLVHREHAANGVGIILQELLAHIEDAPGVGVRLAEEQLCALLDFGMR